MNRKNYFTNKDEDLSTEAAREKFLIVVGAKIPFRFFRLLTQKTGNRNSGASKKVEIGNQNSVASKKSESGILVQKVTGNRQHP